MLFWLLNVAMEELLLDKQLGRVLKRHYDQKVHSEQVSVMAVLWHLLGDPPQLLVTVVAVWVQVHAKWSSKDENFL